MTSSNAEITIADLLANNPKKEYINNMITIDDAAVGDNIERKMSKKHR